MERTARNRYGGRKPSRLDGPVGTHSHLCWLRRADRASLLTGTALVSTLLLTCLLGPNPAQAASCTQLAQPAPISDLNVNATIICVNTEPRINPAGNAIELSTIGNNHHIDLYNNGVLTAYDSGIFTSTTGNHSLISIENVGDIVSGSGIDSNSSGIEARTSGQNSDIIINNSGQIDSFASPAFYSARIAGIRAGTYGDASSVTIDNDADIFARQSGIHVDTYGTDSPVLVTNAAGATIYGSYDESGKGIQVVTFGNDSGAQVVNAGTILVDTLPDPYLGDFGVGINVITEGDRSAIEITNSGTVIKGRYGAQSFVVSGIAEEDDSPVTIVNTGIIDSNVSFGAILGQALGVRSPLTVYNSGIVNYGDCLFYACDQGITTDTTEPYSPTLIVNTGEVYGANLGITARSLILFDYILGQPTGGSPITIVNNGYVGAGLGTGIDAQALVLFFPDAGYEGSPITIVNSGTIVAGRLRGIDAVTSGVGGHIAVENSGEIQAVRGGIRARAYQAESNIIVENSGTVDVSLYSGRGIAATSYGAQSNITVENSGDINALGAGIEATTFNAQSNITVENSDSIDVLRYDGRGIVATTHDVQSGITIGNTGAISAGATIFSVAIGIHAVSYGNQSNITIENADGGMIYGYSAGGVLVGTNTGIRAQSLGDDTTIDISNSGAIYSGSFFAAYSDAGIYAAAQGNNGNIVISNDGLVNSYDQGIAAKTSGSQSDIAIVNASGGTINSYGPGVFATMYGDQGDISIENASGGTINAYAGLVARTYGEDATIEITNSGALAVGNAGVIAQAHTVNGDVQVTNSGAISGLTTPYGYFAAQYGIYSRTYASQSSISIVNSGSVDAVLGIYSDTLASNSSISIVNSGSVHAGFLGIGSRTLASDSSIGIVNSGSIFSDYIGVIAITAQSTSPVTIVNPGLIDSADDAIQSLTFGDDSTITFANSGQIIVADDPSNDAAVQFHTFGTGSNINITNSGSVSGSDDALWAFANGPNSFVIINNSGSIFAGTGAAIDTAGAGSTVINEMGGVITGFVDLTDNPDLFDNEKGGIFEARLASDFGGGLDVFDNAGTVHASGVASFDNLEEFNTQGVISLADGQPDDTLAIGGPVAFHASGNSTLAVDTNLGASESDFLMINGNVSGKTVVLVSNTGPGADVFNSAGIPVVEVNGATGAKDFRLKKPIDTGFFTWDLYFEPGATNVFELRSEPGNNALALPKLTTAVQDQWHTTSDTWFDRTADLRMALSRTPRTDGTAAVLGYQAISPGLWMRGPAAGLNPDGSAFTSSGEASLGQGQLLGFDFAAPNLMSPGDTLIFGVLGGIVASDFDDDDLASSFDLDGGQAGAYVAYLNRGLFINTLIKADTLEVDPNDAPGFAGSLDASNLGVRLDAGYRFGGFGSGMYFEPLATMSVVDSQIDDFTEGGNKIEFDNGTSLQGRLGLRVGTSFAAGGMTVEPFVTGGLWHEFADENEAVLTSSGTKFNLTDDVAATWAEIGAGVNLVDLGAGISGFGKIDVAFSDDIDDASGHAGVRYEW